MISKSDYMLFLKHPAWLWIKKNEKYKLPSIGDNLQAMFDAGHMFEQYAEASYPGGITLGFNDFDEYMSLPRRTEAAISAGEKVLFQARFEQGGFTFIGDIISIVDERTVDLVEIKSSTKVKPEHLFDLAFQTVVLENCGYHVRDISVIHVNNQFVRNGEINPKQITKTTNVTNEVKAKLEVTMTNMRQAADVLEQSTMPDPSPRHAKLGTLNEWIKIYRGLKYIPELSIYDLAVPGADRLGKLEDAGIMLLTDIPDDFNLTEKQRRQVEATKSGSAVINNDKIGTFLDRLQYPLYFLDYETLSSIVPYFDGHRSCQQVPFQYSLHILDAPDVELRHVEYLHRDNSDPARPLAERLIDDLGTTGSIIVWYEGFEKSRNTELGEMFPEYHDAMQAINDRVVDLMIPFSEGWYVDKRFLGSASIKKVLPVLCPELSYKTLGIQEGSAAQRLWMEAVLDGKRANEKQRILDDLVEYCKMDTFAMVRIYEQLLKLV